jgi:hypothetical protein
MPLGQQRLTSLEKVKNVVNKIQPPALEGAFDMDAAIDVAVIKLAALGDGSEELKVDLMKRLKKSRNDEMFPVVNSTVPQEEFTNLYLELLEMTNAPPVPNPENPRATTQPGPPTTSDKIAVRLTRRAGNRIIIPLPMVRNYSPGDIWLADGDRIQLMPMGMTEAGQPLPEQDGKTISSRGIDQIDGVNLLILTHTSVLDGRPEEYLLPAKNHAYYGNAAFVRQWQNSIYQQGSDQLKAGALEMNPIIRKSQINTVAASAAALEERMNPAVDTLKDKLQRKLVCSTTAIGNLPVISQLRNQIEQQVGPISLPVSMPQTTQFNREAFCRSLTP